MTHIHLIQRNRILLQLRQNTLGHYPEHTLHPHVRLLFFFAHLFVQKWPQMVLELGLEVREGTTDAVHFG